MISRVPRRGARENDVEATHRVINKMLGTSSCGEEFAERLGRWASASLQP
jgi:hypothetical protein